MKILFLTQFFNLTQGGGEVAFYLIAKELAEKQHDVHVIRHKMDNEEQRDKLPANLNTYDIGPELQYAGGLPLSVSGALSYFLNSIRFGLKIIRDQDVDVIHANTYLPVFIGVLLSKLTRRPLFVTIHDVALTNGLSFWRQWMNQFKVSSFYSILGYLTELLTIKAPANAVLTVSDCSRDDILKVRKSGSVFVVPNGLDLSSYDVDDAEISYGNEIVYIGRAIFYKNLDVVLKAMKSVVANYPSARLVVLGDGPMKASWEKLAENYGVKDKVLFKGHVSQEEKLDVLKRARALVLPSTWEGFGIVLLEAWALRKPVIVSNVRPLTDLVEHGKDGFHALFSNHQDWTEKILFLLENEKTARQLGNAGHLKLIGKYTIAGAVKKLERLYRNSKVVR